MLGGDGDEAKLVEAVELHHAALAAKPPLRAGVREGLGALATAVGQLVLVTESRQARCIDLLDHHALADHVERVVYGAKSPSLYRELRDVGCTDVMVGDQLDRDIAFAQAAGFVGIHFSGGFTPFWTSDLEVRFDFSIGDFRDLVPIMARLVSAGSSQALSASRHVTQAQMPSERSNNAD